MVVTVLGTSPDSQLWAFSIIKRRATLFIIGTEVGIQSNGWLQNGVCKHLSLVSILILPLSRPPTPVTSCQPPLFPQMASLLLSLPSVLPPLLSKITPSLMPPLFFCNHRVMAYDSAGNHEWSG